MAIYQLSIQKASDGIYWTNRYFTETDTIQQAEAVGDQIVAAEKAVHLTYINFISMRTSSANPGDDFYIVKALTGTGGKATTGPMPLTICARPVLQVGPGRPDAKFLRGCLNPGDIGTATLLAGAAVTFINTNYCDALMAIDDLVSSTGDGYQDIHVSQKISQHQLSRGTRKRTTPVIPVS